MQISVTITALEQGDKPPADLDKAADKIRTALGGKKKDVVHLSVVGTAGTETLQPAQLAPPPDEDVPKTK